MRSKYLVAMAAALLMGAAPLASPAKELIVYHGWSTPSEVGALHVFQDALTAKGHSWKDLAIPHNSGVNVSLVNLVTGGNPPNLFVNSDPGIFRDLAKIGLERDLTDYYAKTGIADNFFPIIKQLSSVDGKMVKIPLFMHIDGAVYWNIAAAKAAGVDPTAWKSVDDMLADFPKIRAAGLIPIAIGGQAFQVGYLFHALLAATAGPEIYNRMYADPYDRTVLDTPEVRKVLDIIREISKDAPPEAENRPWNETTHTVIEGKAVAQIMGDWMKGEWLAAGKKIGTDFGCEVIPGTKAVAVTADAMGALGGQDAETDAAEMDFIAAVEDPATLAKANQAKGSTPPRSDAPTEFLDACNKVAMDALAKPNGQVANPFNITDTDWHNGIWNVVYAFWADKNETDDDAVKALQDAFDQVFS